MKEFVMRWHSSQHSFEITQKNKHLLPPDFNWKQYILLNPDLENAGITSEQYAVEHFLTYGIKENRKYMSSDTKHKIPENFNPKLYKFLNSDLINLTDLQATQHYIEHGQKENRAYITTFNFDNNFDPRLYKIFNPDLAHLTDNQAIQHYAEHGNKEGRVYYTGISYETLIRQKNQQQIQPDQKSCILFLNHDVSLTGAPIFLYDLYEYLLNHNYFTNIVMIDPYPNNLLPSIPNKLYHFNDPQNLLSILENLDPVLIYSNSLNLYVRNLPMFHYWMHKTIFHFHETYEPFHSFINKQIPLLKNSTIKVVSEKIKEEYLRYQNFSNITVFPPFLSHKKLIDIDKNKIIPPIIKNMTRTLDTNKIIIGMAGSLCDRKNFKLFYELAQSYPDIEFVWVGGQGLDEYILKLFNHTHHKIPYNLYWVPNTTNPYKYFNVFDYFFLTSLSDPCPIVVLENLYMNKKIIVLKNNIHTEHPAHKLENFIVIDNTDDTSNTTIIEKFKKIPLEKKNNKTLLNTNYIIDNYQVPKITIKNSDSNTANNYFICSLYISSKLDLSYYINLINQFSIRNEYSYKIIICLSSDSTHDNSIIGQLYKYIINLDKIICRKNIGYDIGGLLDGINYIFTNYTINNDSKLAYVHSKSNIHWRNIINQIFYLDNIDNYDTIVSNKFIAKCDFNDLNRKLFIDNRDIFENNNINISPFEYIQGTVFRTKTIFLKELSDKYNSIIPRLTNIDKDDTYWQSIMKDYNIFQKYFNQYNNNIFNHPIDNNSYKILINNLAKNYIELYKKFNIRGIPDCQIEHAIERYVGFLITNKHRVYKHE